MSLQSWLFLLLESRECPAHPRSVHAHQSSKFNAPRREKNTKKAKMNQRNKHKTPALSKVREHTGLNTL